MAQGIHHIFENYSIDSAAAKKLISSNVLTEEFKNNIKLFTVEKLEHLINNMRADIFYDNTIYTGSAGIALLHYSMATQNSRLPDTDLLSKCLDYLKLDRLKGKRISFLCGDAGPLAIAAAVSYHLRDRKPDTLSDYKYFCNKLIDLESLMRESPDELLYGKAGYLYSLLFVNKQIGKEAIPAQHIKKVIDAIFRSGKKFSAKMKCESPLLWQWHDKIYLGGAHGVAGILYVLLQGRAYISAEDMTSLVQPTLSWLAGLQLESGNFPSSLGSAGGDRLVQWCHGAPGFTPLFLLAHQLLKDETYLQRALQCGEVVWRRMCSKGYSLCHGVSGNAYTFIQLYQATKDPKHLYRACCFMKWCIQEPRDSEQRPPDRPASLFEGLAGRLYFATDMLRVNRAAFPAYTV